MRGSISPPKAPVFRTLLTSNPGPVWELPTNVASWNGSLESAKDDTKLVVALKAFIEECYDPRGRLIITGKSRGAMNALQLCRHLAKFCSFFRLRKLKDWITDDEPKGDFWGSPPDNTPFTVKVRVDLICIADATFDVNGFDRQRQIPGIVRTYANWFQILEDNSGKHGALFPFETSLTAKIKDENCNGRIPTFTLGAHTFLCKKLAPPEVTKLVGAELGTPTPPLTPTIRGSSMPTPQLPSTFRVRR